MGAGTETDYNDSDKITTQKRELRQERFWFIKS